jgi:hypothetical protein
VARFHVVTIDALGNLTERQVCDSRWLDRPAVSGIQRLLREFGRRFQQVVPVLGYRQLVLHWSQEGNSAAAASLWVRGELARTCLLLSGQDDDTDREAQRAAQDMLTRSLVRGPLEPGFDLLAVAERPVLACIPWPNPMVSRPAMELARQAACCLAAAFFEKALEPSS